MRKHSKTKKGFVNVKSQQSKERDRVRTVRTVRTAAYSLSRPVRIGGLFVINTEH